MFMIIIPYDFDTINIRTTVSVRLTHIAGNELMV